MSSVSGAPGGFDLNKHKELKTAWPQGCCLSRAFQTHLPESIETPSGLNCTPNSLA